MSGRSLGLRAGLALSMGLCLWSARASAHEFWLEPARFWTAPGAPSPATLRVGIGGDRERWGVGPGGVTRLTVHGAQGVRDARGQLQLPGGAADAVLAFPQAGLQVVAMESRPALSVLPAQRFEAYLADEGLQSALAWRGAKGQADLAGRETYSRRAKALVQVGAATAADDAAATAVLGLTLEIAPEANPYRLAPGAPLPVRVFYRGRPLAGARVKLFCLDLAQRALAQAVTDRDGRASFTVPPRGDWLLSTVWTRPAATPQADFETIFSSLTFGYPRGAGS